MKKLILLLFVSSVQIAFGQLSNLNLESWTTTSNGPEPSLWTYVDGTGSTVYGTYNSYTPLTTSKITGAQAAGGSGSSAKLQTINDVPGMLYQLKPFSGTMPQAVSFSLKNQTALNDTSFVIVTLSDAAGNVLKQGYLELYPQDNNSNWHTVGIPLVTMAAGTPAGIEFWAQSSYSDYPTVAGSTISLDNITFNNCSTPIVNSFSEVSCEPYVWNGQTYSTSGSYNQTFVSFNGCDSTVTLNLSIINPGPLTAVPDPVFEQKLINLGYDPCGVVDGFVPTNHIDTVTSLIISNGGGITNLTGIEDFLALQTLSLQGANLSVNGINLSSNIQLKSLSLNDSLLNLDLTQNINLESLFLGSVIGTNNIAVLNLSSNVLLKNLNCSHAGIETLILPQTNTLLQIDCSYNWIGVLDLPQTNSITDINCSFNTIGSLNLSNVTGLINLNAEYNHLLALGAPTNNSIQYLNLKHNYFSGLNLSGYSQLKNIECSNNYLECLNLKNGLNNQFTNVKTINNFNLTCIEVDDSTYSTNNPTWNTGIDSWSSFGNQCPLVCFTADIEKLETSSFEIFPNPTLTNEINIKTEETVLGRIYKVIDFKGAIVLQGKIIETIQKVDLKGLTSGIYLFQIEGINSFQRLIIE
jgi:hypothetical protein